MKGLIFKDFINLRGQGKIVGILLVFYIVLSFVSSNPSMLYAVTAILGPTLVISTFAYDEKANWDKYALSMPVSRKDIVISKYLLGIILALAAFLINLMFHILEKSDAIQGGLAIPLALSVGGIVFLSLGLPVMFRFGAEKARTITMLMLFVPVGLITILLKLGVKMPDRAAINALIFAAPFAVIVLFVVSIAVSLKIYGRKEM